MNIEESVEYLRNCLNDEYNFKNATRKKDKEAIETLLTAYEKEKEKNKELENMYNKLPINPKEHLHTKTECKIVIGELQSLLEKE